MKKFALLLLILSIITLPSYSFAAKGGKKGPSAKAHERASDKARFKRDSDWTPGKPGKGKAKKEKVKKEKKEKKEKKAKKEGEQEGKDEE